MNTEHPLSICMVSDDFMPHATGVGTHLQVVCRHLVARGHRVTVVTTRRRGEPEREHWQGVDVHRVPTVRVAGFDQAIPSRARLHRILDEVRPDVVHLHYLGLMMLRTMAVARERALPLVYTYHMTEDHLTQPWFMRPFRPLIARQIVRAVNRMDWVISVSEGIAATLPGKGITRSVTTISNPVEFPDPTQVTPARRDGDFVVLFAGRLEPEKNLPLLIRGFALLAERRPSAVLWIAGRGSQRAALQALASKLGVLSRVRFLGFLDVPGLAARYAACDVFVLPSWVETQGLVALEAMWNGKPVLVSKAIASAEELVTPGVNGWCIDATDHTSLGTKLVEMAASPVECVSMGRAARARVSGLTADQLVPRLEQTYRRVAGMALTHVEQLDSRGGRSSGRTSTQL
jgi:glycosyltransferase involved in cell wall biosynthesis